MQSLLALLPLSWPEPSRGAVRALGFVGVLVPACFVPAAVAVSSGYTASLLVFAVPSLVLASALARQGALGRLSKPLLATCAVLIPMGVVLNLLFADDFFTYPNHRAVAGLSVPALDVTGLDWEHPIPLEEFAFYALGFLAMVLGYAWCSESLAARREAAGRLELRHAIVVPAALVAAGIGLARDRFPSYFVYLAAVPLPVTLALWPLARARLNLLALGSVIAVLVPASFLWEAVLAVPRGWWGYQPEAMLGPTVVGLPLEALVVWGLAPIATAVVFESFRVHWRTR